MTTRPRPRPSPRRSALYRDLGDRLGQMNTLLWTGTLQRVTGDYLAATGSLSRALELSRSLGNRLGEANALHYLGAVRGATGDHAAAASDLLLALDLFRGLGDRQGEANALCYLGDVQVQAGEYDAAAGSLTRALRGVPPGRRPAGPGRGAHRSRPAVPRVGRPGPRPAPASPRRSTSPPRCRARCTRPGRSTASGAAWPAAATWRPPPATSARRWRSTGGFAFRKLLR